MKKHDWKQVKHKSSGVMQFGQWKDPKTGYPISCQIKRCVKSASWMTDIKNIGLIFLCFAHGEDL